MIYLKSSRNVIHQGSDIPTNIEKVETPYSDKGIKRQALAKV